MRVAEANVIDGLNADIAGVISGPAEVSCESVEGGLEYTIGFGDTLLYPEGFYKVLHDTAPKADEDYPDGVVDDWLEPDRTNQDAKDRVKRHQELLGQDWFDFMYSRPTYLDIFTDIPRVMLNENEIRQITDSTEIAGFASAYLVSGRRSEVIRSMLEATGMDNQTIIDLYGSIESCFSEKHPFSRFDLPYIPFPALRMAEELLSQRLLELPNSVADRIVQSTLPRELEAFGYVGLKNIVPAQSKLEGIKFGTNNTFINRFCVRGSRSPGGSLRATPYVYNHFPNQRHSWYIPSWSNFETIERSNAVCQAAVTVDPTRNYSISPSTVPAYAVESGSIHSTVNALRVQPQIRWHTSNSGERRFDISIGTFQTDQGRVVRSGIFGIILAAALQPDLRAKWPKTIKDPSLDVDQDMGIAQLPVLALKMRRQLASGYLLRTAEAAVN